ncbi:Protein ALP1-like [Lucilia cuprina]|nr:Protein ALP1-like [Lucilia cuprina]
MSVITAMDVIKNISSIVKTTIYTYKLYEESLMRSNRRWWVRPVNLTRDSIGFFKTCMEQIKVQDEEHFFKATRMEVSKYIMLLTLLKPKLQKFSRRNPIDPEQRLSITILYLANGCNFQSPKQSGSLFYNYKKFFSIVLLAACDANYAFMYVDVGALGSQRDGGSMFSVSLIINNELDVPNPRSLPNSNIVFPYYFVADNAFPLLKNLMRPYPGKHLPEDKRKFNKNLSKARSRIEISFGIITNRWRILHTSINAYPKNVDKIVLATIVLHNFLIFHKDKQYFNPENAEENLEELENIRLLPSNHSSSDAFTLRDNLKNYLSNIVTL